VEGGLKAGCEIGLRDVEEALGKRPRVVGGTWAAMHKWVRERGRQRARQDAAVEPAAEARQGERERCAGLPVPLSNLEIGGVLSVSSVSVFRVDQVPQSETARGHLRFRAG
jgi:hypothetical protein